jgi:glycine dehydrogenase subunit 2
MNEINKFDNKLSIEKSQKGRKGSYLLKGKAGECHIPDNYIRKTEPNIPELSEFDVVRHYVKLSRNNFSVDTNFYPLGSCTMKYNPKINEEISKLEGFANLHPMAIEDASQGILEIFYDIEKRLCELCGMDYGTFWPVAGAHSEYTGILLAKKYFSVKGENRDEIIVPDSAHGTNPATASMAGFKTINLKSTPDGRLDLNVLKNALNQKTAVVMMTVPNTLGIFETNIKEICKLAHENGTLVYMDGANFNAMIGLLKPGEFGIDIMHLNLHKTFSTPHGGGGPGNGAILVKKELEQFLPVPRVIKKRGEHGDEYSLSEDYKNSIGRVKAHFGNSAIILMAYCYIIMHGAKEFRSIAENAIINANYIKSKLQDIYPAYSKEYCMHECVLAPSRELSEKGIKTLDIAKRLLDYGFHAPTIYFPLIVHEAIMIEPTETENKETMDSFIDTMRKIYSEALENPEYIKNAPHTTAVKRLDEVEAARKPNIRW